MDTLLKCGYTGNPPCPPFVICVIYPLGTDTPCEPDWRVDQVTGHVFLGLERVDRVRKGFTADHTVVIVAVYIELV